MTAPAATARSTATWSNWAGNVEARPREFERPATIDGLRRKAYVKIF